MSVSGDILKEGYLVKAPDAARNLHAFKKWQRKWFRLHQNGDLYYYDSEKASKAAGVIHLLQCYRAYDGKSKGIQMSYCVGLEISGENYYLKADSARVFNDWIRLLSKFAEVSEVSLASPSGSPVPERRGTVGAGYSETATGEGILRTGSTASTISVQSRHFSIATRSRFTKKEGWLAKTGGSNKGWKDRYFVLSSGKLSYFKNEKTDSPQGAVDLFDCTNVSKGSGKKGYGFELEIPGRVFNISAENEQLESEWIAAIRQTLGVIADIKSHNQLQEPMQIPRSGSGSGSSTLSDTSLGSRDLQESTASTASALTISTVAVRERHGTPDGSSSSSAAGGPRREEKDSVIQLLEAEVEALHSKISSLESALASSTAATSQLQDQLSESRGQREGELRHLTEERDNFIAQVLQLERSKSELEAVNDSLQTQLEEHAARIQELEEEGVGLRHELEEVQGGVAASEEELAETQQRLHEIEGIAKDLEAALIRRGEDPQTPLLERRRSFTRSLSSTKIELKQEQGSTESSLTKSTTAPGTTELKELQQQLEMVEQERNDLIKELNTMKEAKKSAEKSSNEEDIKKEAAALLEEGRLKWQMETENMRKEYEAKLEGERRCLAEEKSSKDEALSLAGERYSCLQETLQQQKTEFEKSLTDAQERIQSLESEVSSFQERVGQLQVEKEKAVADLIAIRKINRTMEKKMSEGEVADVRPPSTTSSQGDRVESPDVQHRLLEAEKRVEELQTQLQEVQQERDKLKSQLEKLLSGTSNGFAESDMNLGSMSQFGFKSKSRATIAASAKAPSDPIHSHRTKSFSGAVRPLQIASENRENPPPKPKRPTKELMSKFQPPAPAPAQQEHQTRPRAATMFLRTLFPQR